MNGYLQRLARSVIQPAEKIHPLAGSIFAGSETPKKQEPLAYNLDIAGAVAAPQPEPGQADQIVLPQIQPLVERQLSGRDTQQGDLDVNLRPTTLVPGESTIPPRPSPQTLRTSLSAFQNAFEPLPSTGQQTPEHVPLIPTPVNSSEGAPGSTYDTLMPIKAVVAPGKTVVATTQGAREFGANPRRSAGQSARNLQSARRTEREPDQIEIHIGRIEVAAVPQTQAPPAARVLRKAESLSEYLARRDKRQS